MKPVKIALLLIICICITSAYSQSQLINTKKLKERIKNETLTYKMGTGGDSLGVTITKYMVKDNILSMSESVAASLNGMLISETAKSVYSIKESRLLSNEIKMNMGSTNIHFSGSWNDKNHIKFTFNKSDSILKPKQHIERFSSLFLLPRLIHDGKKNISYTQFNSMDLRFREVSATLKGQELITTPLGKKKCNVIELKGGVATQIIYIDIKSHRIVKIEIPAMRWYYELIKIEPAN